MAWGWPRLHFDVDLHEVWAILLEAIEAHATGSIHYATAIVEAMGRQKGAAHARLAPRWEI